MAKAKWESVIRHLVETGDTIAVEYSDRGPANFFCPKSGNPVHAMSVKATLTRKLIRPAGALIDPTVPQYYEPVEGGDE